MAGFTFAVGGGATGIRQTSAQKDPFVLLQDPEDESLQKADSLLGQGIAYLRKHSAGDDDHVVDTRPVISILNPFGSDHDPRTEGEGQEKFVLWDHGVVEWSPGPSNQIFISPKSNFMGNAHALVFSGDMDPSGTDPSIANANVDLMPVPGVRLPGGSLGGLIPTCHDKWGTRDYLKDVGIKWGICQRYFKFANLSAGGGPTQTTDGYIIPANSFVIGVGYDIQSRAHVGSGADTFDIGVSGDLTRFGSGLNTYAFDDDVLYDSDNPFRFYSSNTDLIITLAGTVDAGNVWGIGVCVVYFQLNFTSVLV